VAPRGPHVRGGRDVVAASELLRRHVLRRAHDGADSSQPGGGVEDPGDAEIGDDGAPSGQEHVVGFQVPVHDAVLVRVSQRIRDLLADLGHSLPRQGPVGPYLSAQGKTRDELHHDPRCPAMLHDIMDGDYPGMAQPRRGLRLPQRAGN
jgi:hypothetical protein